MVFFSIKNQEKIAKIYEYNAENTEIRKAIFSKNEQWLFLANSSAGLKIISIKYNENHIFKEFTIASIFYTNYMSAFALVISSDDKYAYVIDNWDALYIAELDNVYKLNPI